MVKKLLMEEYIHKFKAGKAREKTLSDQFDHIKVDLHEEC
jgi:hypothetical protein